MSGERGGKDLLLKKEDATTPGTYVTIGGLRSKSMHFNNEAIDVTNHGSNEWKEILDGAGIKHMSMSASGVFNSSATLLEIETAMLAGTLTRFQIVDVYTGGRTYTGYFKIASFQRAGEYKGEQTYEISLESSGVITPSNS